jgi:hypothetical protein
VLKIVTADERLRERRGVKILMLGPSGVGKTWQLGTLSAEKFMVLDGTTPVHKEAGEITRRFLRTLLESARGVRPGDQNDKAKAARVISGWQDLDGLRFVARVGVRPPEGGYPAKNFIRGIITPDKSNWKQPEQLPRDQVAGNVSQRQRCVGSTMIPDFWSRWPATNPASSPA